MRSSWNTVGRKPNDQYPKKREEGKDFPSGHCREHEFNPCSGTFHKPCCAAKERERERKEGKIKDKEMGKMATCRWRQRLEWCYHKPSTTRGHWTLEKARKGSP